MVDEARPTAAGLTFHRGRIAHRRMRLCRESCHVSEACNDIGLDLLLQVLDSLSVLLERHGSLTDQQSAGCVIAIALTESSTSTTTSNKLILTKSAASSTGSFQAEASC